MEYGKKYLSDVLSVDEILQSKENKICIVSGVGSGKNYFVTNVLAGHGKIMCVSSRRAKVDEMLHEKICEERINWNNCEQIFTTTNYGIELLVKNQRFSTYGIKVIKEHFDFLVIDEFHSIATDATYADSSYHVCKFVEYIAETCPYIKIIGMTGTPEPIDYFLKRNEYKVIDRRSDCINVTPKRIETITKEDAIKIMRTLPKEQKTMYYTNSATGAIIGENSLYLRLREEGTLTSDEIGFSMAESKAYEIMKNKDVPIEKLAAHVKENKKYITENQTLPPSIRILITTSTLKEGINIVSKDIKISFCESHLLSDIQQFAGRVRDGLDILYIVEDGEQFSVTKKEIQENYIEVLYNISVLEKTNGFIVKSLINGESSIYQKQWGEYDKKEIEYFYLFEVGNMSIYSTNDAIKFFVDSTEKKYKFIRFNHLKNAFDVFVAYYREQLRIYNYFLQDWKKTIKNYCGGNKIDFVDRGADKIAALEKILEGYVGRKLYYEEEKKELKNYIVDTLGVYENAQPTTFSKALKEVGLPFIIDKGGSTKKRKSVRYYVVKRI